MDIVERLRGFRYFDRGEPASPSVCMDAAAEIEWMRTHLKEIEREAGSDLALREFRESAQLALYGEVRD